MKFKLPGLGKLLGRKKGEDDDAGEEDFEEEEAPEAREGEARAADDDVADEDTKVAARPPAHGGDDEDDEEFWEDEEQQRGARGGWAARLLAPLAGLRGRLGPAIAGFVGEGKRRVAVLSGLGLLALILVGGGGFLIFAGGGEPPPPAAVAEKAKPGMETPPPPQFGPGGAPPEVAAEQPPAGAQQPLPPAEAQAGMAGQAPAPGQSPAGASDSPPGAQPSDGSFAPPPSPSTTGLVTPSSQPQAFARLAEAASAEKPLVAQPDPALLERTAMGALPKAGPGGRTSWQAYARPTNPNEDRPRVAIIVKGVGLSAAATDAAIRRLPGVVTLALDPHAPNLEAVGVAARTAGHEILLTLPLASDSFPARDPGPFALQVSQDPAENINRLKAVLGRASGYVGVLSLMGGTLLGRDDQIRPVLAELKNRGVMFVDGGSAGKSLAMGIATELGLPRAIAKIVIDEDPSRAAIDAKLAEVEKVAKSAAATVAVASAYPATLERLVAWLGTLNAKQLAIMPITALADRQFE